MKNSSIKTSRQIAFVKGVSLISREFAVIYENESRDGFGEIPIYIAERYVDYILKEFKKLNHKPMDDFLGYCEKNINNSTCNLIGVTLGESLMCTHSDKFYLDYIKTAAGTKTKKCLGVL